MYFIVSGQEIPILLVGGKYTKGTNTLSVVEKAGKKDTSSIHGYIVTFS